MASIERSDHGEAIARRRGDVPDPVTARWFADHCSQRAAVWAARPLQRKDLMPAEIVLRSLESPDLAALEARSHALGRYLEEQASGLRLVRIAEYHDVVAGYVTLLWSADDPVLRRMNVPEVSDLWVREDFRARGVGSALLTEIERLAASKCDTIGLNVGLHSGYGSAQRIYVRRGYVPDGAGVVVDGQPVPEGGTIRLDDDPIVTLRMTKTLLDTSAQGRNG